MSKGKAIAQVFSAVAVATAFTVSGPFAPDAAGAPCAESAPTGVAGRSPSGVQGSAVPNVCCVKKVEYSLSATSVRIPYAGVPTFKDGPGGELTVSRTYSGTASLTVTAGAEAEAGVVLAKAKTSISAALTGSKTTSTDHKFRREIASGMYGNVRYVSWGKKVTYRKYRINANCSTTTLARGSMNIPSDSEGWYYWETSS